MALINYPQVPNLWGRDEPNRGPAMLQQAMMFDTKVQMDRQSMLQDIFKELNPVTFLNDKRQLEQQTRIENFTNYVAKISKDNRGRLSPQDMMGIQYEFEKVQEWQARSLQTIAQLGQQMEIYKKAKPGTYDLPTMMAGVNHVQTKGEMPPGGILKIAPQDYLGAAEQIEAPGEIVSSRQDNVYKDGAFRDVTFKITESGVLSADGKTIDVAATEKQKDTLAWGMLNSDPGYHAWADKMYEQFKITNPEEAIGYEEKAKSYAANAKAQSVVDGMGGQQKRDYPEEIKASYIWAKDRFKERLWEKKVVDTSELEGDALRKMRMEQAAEAKKTVEPAPQLETLAAGGDWNVGGIIGTFKGKDNDPDERTFVSYKPTKTQRVNGIEKGTNYLVDPDTWILSVPETSSWEGPSSGYFAKSVPNALNRSLPVMEAFVDYDVDMYKGEKMYIKYQGKKYKYESGQPISAKEREALEQHALDEGRDIADYIQSSNRDFARIILGLGSVGGVKGTMAVYRELSDGYADSELKLKDKGYVSTYAEPEESEKVIPDAKKKTIWEKARDLISGSKDAGSESTEGVQYKNIQTGTIDGKSVEIGYYDGKWYNTKTGEPIE